MKVSHYPIFSFFEYLLPLPLSYGLSWHMACGVFLESLPSGQKEETKIDRLKAS
jgi:hypothetical protein